MYLRLARCCYLLPEKYYIAYRSDRIHDPCWVRVVSTHNNEPQWIWCGVVIERLIPNTLWRRRRCWWIIAWSISSSRTKHAFHSGIRVRMVSCATSRLAPAVWLVHSSSGCPYGPIIHIIPRPINIPTYEHVFSIWLPVLQSSIHTQTQRAVERNQYINTNYTHIIECWSERACVQLLVTLAGWPARPTRLDKYKVRDKREITTTSQQSKRIQQRGQCVMWLVNIHENGACNREICSVQNNNYTHTQTHTH